MPDWLGVTLAIALLLLLIAVRAPIFVALAASGLLGLFLLLGLSGLEQVPLSLSGQLLDYALVAAPMYILMGEALSVSGLGRDLFSTAYRWLGRVPGGLGASAIGASTVFGAMSGVSISSVAVVGRMAVPEMLSRGYRPSFASGTVVASGALAMLIPPSLMFILYSSVTGVSIAALFAGGLVPGLLLSALMICYVVITARLRPSYAPSPDERFTWGDRFRALGRSLPALLLVIVVLGSIYTGLATPTEAAAVGAVGAFLLVGLFYRALTPARLWQVLKSTTQVSASILAIVGSAFVFTQMLVVVRVPEHVSTFIVGLDVPRFVIVLAVMLVLLVLGCLVDAASLLLVVTPILVPALTALGYDPLWIGVLLVINLEMAVITPPVGLNLYTMKSVAPGLDLSEIFRGIVPYLFIEFGVILLVIAVPEIATWLPSLMEG
ncbi:MAG: TRAP transporter large permease subunit [Streptosporangiales bacterium]|nr:TRAP transporter large permease subunit [Streptosporangiales bacterium]